MPESRFASFRNAFLTGLLLLAPLAVTWLAFSWLVDKVGGSFRDIFFFFVPVALRNHQGLAIVWNLLSTFLVILLVTGLGYFSRLFLGQYVGAMAERLVQSLPGVGSFYNMVKQFVDTFGSSGNQFSKVVLIEYPRPGAYALGFLTNTQRAEPHTKFDGEYWAVFVPTCPSPTNGFYFYVPSAKVIELEMSVGEGMKAIISCGAVLPAWSSPEEAKAALGKPRC